MNKLGTAQVRAPPKVQKAKYHNAQRQTIPERQTIPIRLENHFYPTKNTKEPKFFGKSQCLKTQSWPSNLAKRFLQAENFKVKGTLQPKDFFFERKLPSAEEL